jgi:branched-chain amino acid transport system permease protein
MAQSRMIIGIVAAALVLTMLPLIGDVYVTYVATQILIFVLFATSLNLLLGYAGLVSFGHAAYFAIGGYACSIFITTLQWPLMAAYSAAVALSGLAALLIGYFCVRLTTIYFSMLTLAFAQLVWAIAFKWKVVTGGDDGFLRIAVPEALAEPAAYYLFTLVVVTASMTALWVIAHSAFGRMLVTIRENPVRAGFMGVDIKRVQTLAFAIGGAFAGAAGALFAMFNRSFFPDSAWWTQSAEVLIMVVLGGMHAFFGPAVGAATLIVLSRLTSEVTEYWPAVLAAILLIVLFAFPDGIAGLFTRRPRAEVCRAAD